MVSLQHLFEGDLRIIMSGVHNVSGKRRPGAIHDLMGGHQLSLVQAGVEAEDHRGDELGPLVAVPLQELPDVSDKRPIGSLDLRI